MTSRPGWLLVGMILVAAANLRTPLTAVGPVLDRLGEDLDLSPAALGALGAVPMLTFAVVSPLVHRLSRRLGMDRAVLVAMIALALGTALRSIPSIPVSLWTGTVLLAAAIAVANVLVPAILKRDAPGNVPTLTGLYTSVMTAFAALASGVAVPLAIVGGWQLSLGIWAPFALGAAAIWFVHVRKGSAARSSAPIVHAAPPVQRGSMWTSLVAWQVGLFMGMQSLCFYLLITWLPSIEHSLGITPTVAGWHLFTMQVVGIGAGLVAGRLIAARRSERGVGLVAGALMTTAMLGFTFAPSLIWGWVALSGLASGTNIVVALTLMSSRSRDSVDAGRLSGMAQGVGYLLAALGPWGAGALYSASGSWRPVLIVGALIGLGQAVLALSVGRAIFTHGDPDPASNERHCVV